MTDNLPEKPKRHSPFVKGNKFGRGRPKGSQAKATKPIADALIEAAQRVGADGKGKEGMVGYLTMCAKKYPKTFLTVLGRVIPIQVAAPPGTTVNMVNRIEIVAGVRHKDLPSEDDREEKVIELKRA